MMVTSLILTVLTTIRCAVMYPLYFYSISLLMFPSLNVMNKSWQPAHVLQSVARSWATSVVVIVAHRLDFTESALKLM